MASAFAHAAAAVAIGAALTPGIGRVPARFWVLGVICSLLPDLDIISFRFGVAYGEFWGHRGFTHSLAFAVLSGLAVATLFLRSDPPPTVRWRWNVLFLTAATASHGVLDAMTDGGLGVAFFSPFEDARYFLPWRPIMVSPIGIGEFFSPWGLAVVKSELVWVGLPSLAVIGLAAAARRLIRDSI